MATTNGGWRLWLRWSWRDLRHRWVLVLATALIIAIGTGTFAGMGGTTPWRIASNDASYAQLGYHDLKVSLPEGGFVPAGVLTRAARSIPHADQITGVQERLVVPTQVDASTATTTVLVPGRIVGTDPDGRIDTLYVTAGRAPSAADPGATALLESKFAGARGLSSTGSLKLSGDRGITYTGVGYSPEYFRVMGPGFLTGEGDYAVLFLPLATAQMLTGHPEQVNDLVLTLARGADPAVVADDLRAVLAPVGGTVSGRDDDPVYHALYADARNDEATWNFLALLIMLGASFAAFNLISRMVDAQRHEIGIGMALGTRRWRLASRPLLVGVQVAALGALAGVGVGLLAARGMRSVFETALPLPQWVTPFPAGRYALAAALGLILPLLATAIPVWRAVRIEPVEALHTGPRATRGAGLTPLLSRWFGAGRRRTIRVIRRLPARSLLRAPRRTILTALGIAAAVTSLVAVLGTLDSIVGAFDRADSDLARRNPDRMQVTLDRFYPVDGPQVSAITSAASVAAAAPGLRLGGTVSAGGTEVDVTLELLNPATALWTPDVTAGDLPVGGDGLVLAEKAATDLNVQPGDTVTLRHPVLEGASYRLMDSTVLVAGVHASPLRFLAYANSDQAERFGLAGLANVVTVSPAADASEDQVRRELFKLPGVASVEAVARLGKVLEDRLGPITGILQLLEGFALALVLLIAFNSARISVEERSREQATMFAFGLPIHTALRLLVTESVLTGLLGTLIGIGGGYLAVSWLISTFTTSTVPELGIAALLSWGSIVSTMILGVLVVAAAPLIAGSRLTRMDIPSTLRVLE